MWLSSHKQHLQTKEQKTDLRCTTRPWKIWDKSVFNIFCKTYKITGAVHKRTNIIKINYNTTRTKICYKLNRRQPIVREHTSSAHKKEYFDSTIFQYSFTKLIYEITVFLLISILGLYLIPNVVGPVLIGRQRLKECGTYLKVREIHHIKFQNFVLALVNNENETQNLSVNKPKKMKASKYWQ